MSLRYENSNYRIDNEPGYNRRFDEIFTWVNNNIQAIRLKESDFRTESGQLGYSDEVIEADLNRVELCKKSFARQAQRLSPNMRLEQEKMKKIATIFEYLISEYLMHDDWMCDTIKERLLGNNSDWDYCETIIPTEFDDFINHADCIFLSGCQPNQNTGALNQRTSIFSIDATFRSTNNNFQHKNHDLKALQNGKSLGQIKYFRSERYPSPQQLQNVPGFIVAASLPAIMETADCVFRQNNPNYTANTDSRPYLKNLSRMIIVELYFGARAMLQVCQAELNKCSATKITWKKNLQGAYLAYLAAFHSFKNSLELSAVNDVYDHDVVYGDKIVAYNQHDEQHRRSLRRYIQAAENDHACQEVVEYYNDLYEQYAGQTIDQLSVSAISRAFQGK